MGIEKLAMEIEEIANGVYPSDKPSKELLIGKAKKIQQLARRRKIVVTERVEKLVCPKCDLRMVFDFARGIYRVYRCEVCGNQVGVLP